MVFKVVENFLVVADNSMDKSLESFKLLRYADSPLMTNRMMAFKGKVVDVNVKRNDGVLGFNLFFDKHTVIGGLDLDKVREVAFPEDLVLTVKDGLPSIKLVLAGDFDALPISFKDHKWFGEAFRTAYIFRQSSIKNTEQLKQLGLSQQRIDDLLSQSLIEFHQKMADVVKATSDNTLSKGKKESETNVPETTIGGGF